MQEKKKSIHYFVLCLFLSMFSNMCDEVKITSLLITWEDLDKYLLSSKSGSIHVCNILQMLHPHECYSKVWWRTLWVPSSLERSQAAHWAWGDVFFPPLRTHFTFSSSVECHKLSETLFFLHPDWNFADQDQESAWGQRPPEKGAARRMSV